MRLMPRDDATLPFERCARRYAMRQHDALCHVERASARGDTRDAAPMRRDKDMLDAMFIDECRRFLRDARRRHADVDEFDTSALCAMMQRDDAQSLSSYLSSFFLCPRHFMSAHHVHRLLFTFTPARPPDCLHDRLLHISLHRAPGDAQMPHARAKR
jgi:hypothetical protein